VQDDDVAAEEEKVLSGSTDDNDIVIIKHLMKVRQSSIIEHAFVGNNIYYSENCAHNNYRFTGITPAVRPSQRSMVLAWPFLMDSALACSE
jgi:hypothetical protein